MDTGSECHGTIFYSSKNISRMYWSIRGVHKSLSTDEFSTVSKHKLTCNVLTRTKMGLVLSSVVGFLIKIRKFGVGWLFSLCF